MLLSVGYVIASILLLYFGAEFSLNSAEKIGKKLGLSPLFIGMVLVGFGTSLPEFFVAHIAAYDGKMTMAVGSLVGSNISNLCLILGVGSLLVSLKTFSNGLRKHLVIHCALIPVLFFVAYNKSLQGLSMFLLLGLSLAYLQMLFIEMKQSRGMYQKEKIDDQTYILLIKIIIGFVFLYLGGELLVKGGTELAQGFGVSEYIISAILLAFGTSLPELITSFIACIKKIDTDVIIGNIIGSNLFNCALIMGSLGFYKAELVISLNTELIVLTIGSVGLLVLNLFKLPLNKILGIGYLGLYGFMVYFWIS